MVDYKSLNSKELNVQLEAEMKRFKRILAKNPKDHMALYQKGLVHYNMYQTKDAITCFDRSIGLNPNNPHVWASKGDAIIRLDSYKSDNKKDRDAIKCYDHALRLAPDEYTYGAKGEVLAFLGEYENANECYEAAIKIDPNIAKIWELKGEALSELGRGREANKCFSMAAKIWARDFAQENHD